MWMVWHDKRYGSQGNVGSRVYGRQKPQNLEKMEGKKQEWHGSQGRWLSPRIDACKVVRSWKMQVRWSLGSVESVECVA